MVIAIAPAQHTSALGNTVVQLSSQTHGQDQIMDKSNPWNPANIVFTSDYDCTFTVKDTCEVWAKEKALDIRDDSMMAVYDALWEKYEKQLKAQIADSAVEDEQLSGDGADRYKSLGQASSSRCKCNVIMKMENFVRMGLDPRLESAIRAYNDTEHSTADCTCASPEPLFGDSSNLRKMLKQLAKLERDINAKVIATGFLGGLRRKEVRFAGKQATMQNACLEFLSRLTAVGTTVHVISANWSRDIIYGGLSSLPEEQLSVHCNDLEYNASGESSGYFENRVTSAIEKESIQRAVRNLSNSQAPAAASNQTRSKMVVYFGDAQTDLLALLDADLGIVMGQRPALHKLIAQHGIKLLPLKEAAAVLSVWRLVTFRQSGVLFQATGWQDVEACFFG